MATAKTQEIRRAWLEVQQRADRAAHVTRWGSPDPREEAIAHRDVHALRAEALDRLAELQAAELEDLRVSAETAAARAPAWRAHHQGQALAIYDRALEIVRLCDAVEASGAEARNDSCINGTWQGEQAFDNSIIDLAGQIRTMLPAWKQRMVRAGWLSS